MARSEGHRADGNPCNIKRNLNALGYCRFHERQALPRCQGRFLDTNEPCTKPAKENYNFCCAAHDSTLPHIAPRIFDPLGFYLRHQMQDVVVARYNGNDIYNREALDLTTPANLELDHIVEKQCFTHAMLQMDLREGDDDFYVARDMLRESVVNKADNLALTRRSTNRIKGEGVWKFLDDTRTGHLGQQKFTSYLLNAAHDGESLTRDVTRRISRNMKRSMKKAQRTLSREGETPVLERLSAQVHKLYVDMELSR